jgi:hypothetical protein
MSGSQAIKELDHSESGVGSIPTDTNLVRSNYLRLRRQSLETG